MGHTTGIRHDRARYGEALGDRPGSDVPLIDLGEFDPLVVHRHDRRLDRRAGLFDFTLRDGRRRDDSDRALQARRQPRRKGDDRSAGHKGKNNKDRTTCHKSTRSISDERPRSARVTRDISIWP
jgi:hypothetical protein